MWRRKVVGWPQARPEWCHPSCHLRCSTCMAQVPGYDLQSHLKWGPKHHPMPKIAQIMWHWTTISIASASTFPSGRGSLRLSPVLLSLLLVLFFGWCSNSFDGFSWFFLVFEVMLSWRFLVVRLNFLVIFRENAFWMACHWFWLWSILIVIDFHWWRALIFIACHWFTCFFSEHCTALTVMNCPGGWLIVTILLCSWRSQRSKVIRLSRSVLPIWQMRLLACADENTLFIVYHI